MPRLLVSALCLRSPTGARPANGKKFAKMFAQVAFSPKGDQLALASVDAAIELWDLKSLQKSRALKGHTGPIISLVFSPDGAGLISASVDGSIRIWDLRPESPDHIPNAHSDRIWSVALSPDGRSLASAGWDGKVKLWDIETWTNKATLNGFRHQVFCVAFAPDGRTLAASGGDQFDWDQSGEIKVLDLEYKMLDLSRALQLVLWAQEVSRQEATFKLKFSLLW